MTTVPAGSRITTAIINKTYALADTNAHTVTAATVTNLSTSYTIAANDATVGTVYYLTASGTGTEATGTAVTGTWAGALNANQNLGSAAIAGASIAAAGGNFRWWAELEVVVVATGAGGSVNACGRGALLSSGGVATPFVFYTAGVAMDTTTSKTFAVQFNWASTTGSPTITCDQTVFKRFGA